MQTEEAANIRQLTQIGSDAKAWASAIWCQFTTWQSLTSRLKMWVALLSIGEMLRCRIPASLFLLTSPSPVVSFSQGDVEKMTECGVNCWCCRWVVRCWWTAYGCWLSANVAVSSNSSRRDAAVTSDQLATERGLTLTSGTFLRPSSLLLSIHSPPFYPCLSTFSPHQQISDSSDQ